MERAFFDLDLLKTKTITLFVKVVKARSLPLLIFFVVRSFEVGNVLGHLLQDFGLEMALGLAGSHLRFEAIWTSWGGGEVTIGQVAIELALLRGRR